jgi:hypothetical protein
VIFSLLLCPFAEQPTTYGGCEARTAEVMADQPEETVAPTSVVAMLVATADLPRIGQSPPVSRWNSSFPQSSSKIVGENILRKDKARKAGEWGRTPGIALAAGENSRGIFSLSR